MFYDVKFLGSHIRDGFLIYFVFDLDRMKCIILYKGQEHYDDDLSLVTKWRKKIFLQNRCTKPLKEQCNSITSEESVGMLYHRKPFYNQFGHITRNSHVNQPPAATKSSVSQPRIPTTHSKRKTTQSLMSCHKKYNEKRSTLRFNREYPDREKVREYPEPLTVDIHGTKIKEQLQ